MVALITDTPAVGVAFDSIGRFAQSGIPRDRMIPRVLAASPDALLEDWDASTRPRFSACASADEKPAATATGRPRPPPCSCVLGLNANDYDAVPATIARRSAG